jgi:hypothetical protein
MRWNSPRPRGRAVRERDYQSTLHLEASSNRRTGQAARPHHQHHSNYGRSLVRGR